MKKIAIALIAAIAYSMPVVATKAGVITPVVVHMRITAYSSTPAQTDSTPFITANGTHVRDGIVATNLLPFGTELTIPALFGDKVFTVEDRMSEHFRNTVDIWMASTAGAIRFGVHHTDVQVISEPSPLLSLH